MMVEDYGDGPAFRVRHDQGRTRFVHLLQDLHDSEINWGAQCFWDSQWSAWIGDDMNGRKFETDRLGSLEEVVEWLTHTACENFPDSQFALFADAVISAPSLAEENARLREALVRQAEMLDEAASECRTAAVASAAGSAERQAFSDLAYGLTCAADRARAALNDPHAAGAQTAAKARRPSEMMRHLGTLAIPYGSAGIGLECHHCEVSWVGCAAECCCPECGAPKHYWPDENFGKCACEECRAPKQRSE